MNESIPLASLRISPSHLLATLPFLSHPFGPPKGKMYTKLFASLALLVIPGVARGLIKTCEDLQAAFELTQTQDVVDEISTFADIECPTFTYMMTMTSNTLTLNSAEDSCR